MKSPRAPQKNRELINYIVDVDLKDKLIADMENDGYQLIETFYINGMETAEVQFMKYFDVVYEED